MELVDKTNVDSQPFLNIKEQLQTITDLPIRSSFSKNTKIPVILIEDSYEQDAMDMGDSPRYLVTIDIDVNGKTNISAITESKNVTNLLTSKDNIDLMEGYNMSFQSISTSNIASYERENEKFSSKVVTVQYIVK